MTGMSGARPAERSARRKWLVAGAALALIGAVAIEARTASGSATPSCTNRTKLAGWSNRRLAMQTIAVPVAETSLWRVTAEVHNGAGGVLLFGTSAPSKLGPHLAALESSVPGHLGLLVMTDEEGGGVQRMANLVGSLPWAAWMGKHWTAAEIRHAVAAVGSKMAAAHVNMDLAPVVDVDGKDVPPSSTDPDGWRSFSGSTAVVGRDSIAFMRGLTSSHVIAVLKHFPGLGGSTGNSDYGPAHTVPWSTLRRVAIPPFAEAITNGAPAVMVANDTVPGLTRYPASLSRIVISRELKGNLHFRGLVLTDALNANAISAAGFSMPEAAVRALKAGADMVIFSAAPNVASETSAIASAIVSSVAVGHLSRARLIGAAAAVLAARHAELCGHS
jgi:beta-N-acetylhexosaminidase